MTTQADFEILTYGAAPGTAKKLVFLLHGYGRNATYMQKMADEILCRVPDTAVLSPQAPEFLDMSGISKDDADHFLHIPQELRQGDVVYDRATMRQWFAIDGSLTQLFPRVVRAARDMNEFIDRMRDAYGLRDSDIVLMGFSQGAGLALYTATTRNGELAGLVVHSSILLHNPQEDPHMVTKPRALFIYGTKDPEFPQEVYAASFDALQAYAQGRVTHHKITGLGHFTNAESRHVSAEFIADVLSD